MIRMHLNFITGKWVNHYLLNALFLTIIDKFNFFKGILMSLDLVGFEIDALQRWR